MLTVMHNKILGGCCNEKQKERIASEKAHMRKDTGKSREEVSLTVSEIGNGVLLLDDKYKIIRVRLAIEGKADFSLNFPESNKKHRDLE